MIPFRHIFDENECYFLSLSTIYCPTVSAFLNSSSTHFHTQIRLLPTWLSLIPTTKPQLFRKLLRTKFDYDGSQFQYRSSSLYWKGGGILLRLREGNCPAAWLITGLPVRIDSSSETVAQSNIRLYAFISFLSRCSPSRIHEYNSGDLRRETGNKS